jgi:hypothetical protein
MLFSSFQIKKFSVIMNPWQRSVGKRCLAFNEMKHVGSQAKLSKYQGSERYKKQALEDPCEDLPFQ